MKSEVIVMFIGLAAIGSAFAQSYDSAKYEHKQLTKEIKEINRQIEKTGEINCFTSFQKFLSAFFKLFPMATHLHQRFLSGPMECEDNKNTIVTLLKKKKEFKETLLEEFHDKMKALHPMKGRKGYGKDGEQENAGTETVEKNSETTNHPTPDPKGIE